MRESHLKPPSGITQLQKIFSNLLAMVIKYLEHEEPPGVELVPALVLLQREELDELGHLGRLGKEVEHHALNLVQIGGRTLDLRGKRITNILKTYLKY